MSSRDAQRALGFGTRITCPSIAWWGQLCMVPWRPSVTITAVSRRVLGGVRASPPDLPPGTIQKRSQGISQPLQLFPVGSGSREGQGLIQGVGYQGTGKTRSQRSQPCSGQLLHCVALCDPMDCSPPGFSVHGIVRTRILEQVAIASSKGSSPPRDRTCISCIAGRFFTAEPVTQPAVI